MINFFLYNDNFYFLGFGINFQNKVAINNFKIYSKIYLDLSYLNVTAAYNVISSKFGFSRIIIKIEK